MRLCVRSNRNANETVEFYSTDFVFAASGGICFLPLHFVSRAPGGQAHWGKTDEQLSFSLGRLLTVAALI